MGVTRTPEGLTDVGDNRSQPGPKRAALRDRNGIPAAFARTANTSWSRSSASESERHGAATNTAAGACTDRQVAATTLDRRPAPPFQQANGCRQHDLIRSRETTTPRHANCKRPALLSKCRPLLQGNLKGAESLSKDYSLDRRLWAIAMRAPQPTTCHPFQGRRDRVADRLRRSGKSARSKGSAVGHHTRLILASELCRSRHCNRRQSLRSSRRRPGDDTNLPEAAEAAAKSDVKEELEERHFREGR